MPGSNARLQTEFRVTAGASCTEGSWQATTPVDTHVPVDAAVAVALLWSRE